MDSKKVKLEKATLKEVFVGITGNEEKADMVLDEIQQLVDSHIVGEELMSAVNKILINNKLENLSFTSVISNGIASTMGHPRYK